MQLTMLCVTSRVCAKEGRRGGEKSAMTVKFNLSYFRSVGNN